MDFKRSLALLAALLVLVTASAAAEEYVKIEPEKIQRGENVDIKILKDSWEAWESRPESPDADNWEVDFRRKSIDLGPGSESFTINVRGVKTPDESSNYYIFKVPTSGLASSYDKLVASDQKMYENWGRFQVEELNPKTGESENFEPGQKDFVLYDDVIEADSCVASESRSPDGLGIKSYRIIPDRIDPDTGAVEVRATAQNNGGSKSLAGVRIMVNDEELALSEGDLGSGDTQTTRSIVTTVEIPELGGRVSRDIKDGKINFEFQAVQGIDDSMDITDSVPASIQAKESGSGNCVRISELLTGQEEDDSDSDDGDTGDDDDSGDDGDDGDNGDDGSADEGEMVEFKYRINSEGEIEKLNPRITESDLEDGVVTVEEMPQVAIGESEEDESGETLRFIFEVSTNSGIEELPVLTFYRYDEEFDGAIHQWTGEKQDCGGGCAFKKVYEVEAEKFFRRTVWPTDAGSLTLHTFYLPKEEGSAAARPILKGNPEVEHPKTEVKGWVKGYPLNVVREREETDDGNEGETELTNVEITVTGEDGRYRQFTTEAGPRDSIRKIDWDLSEYGDNQYKEEGRTVSRTYETGGEKQVELKVTAEDGTTETTSRTIEIEETNEEPEGENSLELSSKTISKGETLKINIKAKQSLAEKNYKIVIKGPNGNKHHDEIYEETSEEITLQTRDKTTGTYTVKMAPKPTGIFTGALEQFLQLIGGPTKQKEFEITAEETLKWEHYCKEQGYEKEEGEALKCIIEDIVSNCFSSSPPEKCMENGENVVAQSTCQLIEYTYNPETQKCAP